jgi:hypothetical protein
MVSSVTFGLCVSCGHASFLQACSDVRLCVVMVRYEGSEVLRVVNTWLQFSNSVVCLLAQSRSGYEADHFSGVILIRTGAITLAW